MIAAQGTSRWATAASLVLWLMTGQLRAPDFTRTTNVGTIIGTNFGKERVMLPLAKGKWGQTQVLYWHTNTSGPWSLGNCMFFEANPAELEGRSAGMADVIHWRVFNIHAENFHEITKRLGLTSVEAEVIHKGLWRQTTTRRGAETVQVVDEGDCIITDARIPKEWLRSSPCVCYSKADWRKYLGAYPDKFDVAEER